MKLLYSNAMKNILFLLLCIPTICLAQINADTAHTAEPVQDSILGTSFILKDHSVIFQKVYPSALSKDQLISRLKYFLPTVKNFKLSALTIENSDLLTGRIVDFMVNYQKFGGSDDYNTSMLAYPIQANVIIQIKDNKYRVTVSEIIFKGFQNSSPIIAINTPLDDLVSRNQRTKVRTADRYLKIAKFVNDDLSMSFDVSATNNISSNF